MGSKRFRLLRCGLRDTHSLLLLCWVLAVIPGCVGARSRGSSGFAAVGMPAPDFALHTVGTDQTIRLSSLRGKPVILNFFCGCSYCRDLARSWTHAKSKLGSAKMLAVMFNMSTFNPVAVREFRAATHFDAPILADVGSGTALRYRSVDCPMVWVIDRDGIVRWHNASRTDPPGQIVAGVLDSLKKM